MPVAIGVLVAVVDVAVVVPHTHMVPVPLADVKVVDAVVSRLFHAEGRVLVVADELDMVAEGVEIRPATSRVRKQVSV